MNHHLIQLVGTEQDEVGFRDLRSFLDGLLGSAQLSQLLFKASDVSTKLTALLDRMKTPTIASVPLLYVWGDDLLRQTKFRYKTDLNLRRNITQNFQNCNHLALILHVEEDLLDWLEDVEFFDFLSTGQQKLEWLWRIQRCAQDAHKKTNALVTSFSLPEGCEILHLSTKERKLLQILYAAQNNPIKKQNLCNILKMNPDSRSLLNLISSTNHKCQLLNLKIKHIPDLGYALVPLS